MVTRSIVQTTVLGTTVERKTYVVY